MSNGSKWQTTLKGPGTLVTFVGEQSVLDMVRADKSILSDVLGMTEDYFADLKDSNEAYNEEYLVKKAQVELSIDVDADGVQLVIFDKANDDDIERITLDGGFEVGALEGCCGVDVVHSFDKKVVNATVLEHAADPEVSDRPGALLATTIDTQTAAIEALQRAGFKAVGEFMGRGRNNITLWLKVNKPVK